MTCSEFEGVLRNAGYSCSWAFDTMEYAEMIAHLYACGSCRCSVKAGVTKAVEDMTAEEMLASAEDILPYVELLQRSRDSE